MKLAHSEGLLMVARRIDADPFAKVTIGGSQQCGQSHAELRTNLQCKRRKATHERVARSRGFPSSTAATARDEFYAEAVSGNGEEIKAKLKG